MEYTAEAAKAYRRLADDMRRRAATMKDPNNKTVMLSVAQSYDGLADVLENYGQSGWRG
jgi:hypothetical protein